jgi:hypothetical protein
MRMNPLTRRGAFVLVGLILTVTSTRPVAAATCGPYGVGFGANELQPQTSCALALASQARIDWVRLGLYWQNVEPNPGQFDFQADDALIASTRATQLNVLAILAYSTTWSTSAPADSPGNLTHHPPHDYGEWANYVTAIVTRYKSDVHYSRKCGSPIWPSSGMGAPPSTPPCWTSHPPPSNRSTRRRSPGSTTRPAGTCSSGTGGGAGARGGGSARPGGCGQHRQVRVCPCDDHHLRGTVHHLDQYRPGRSHDYQ